MNKDIKHNKTTFNATSDEEYILEIKGKKIPQELRFKKQDGVYRKAVIGEIESKDLISQIITYGGIVFEWKTFKNS